MLKVLLRKQFTEVFRSYFYNRRKKQMRSKGNIIVMFLLFGFLLVGVLGGAFTAAALGMCAGMAEAGMADRFCFHRRIASICALRRAGFAVW